MGYTPYRGFSPLDGWCSAASQPLCYRRPLRATAKLLSASLSSPHVRPLLRMDLFSPSFGLRTSWEASQPLPFLQFAIPSCGAMGITRILSPFSQEAQRSWLGWGCTLRLPGHLHGSSSWQHRGPYQRFLA